MDDISRSVGHLECGSEHGTAVFLSFDRAITCRHCVVNHLLEGDRILIHVDGGTIEATIFEPAIPEAHDAVILSLTTAVAEDRLLPLVASNLPRGAKWETFGFPNARAQFGMGLDGRVARAVHSEDTPRDIELECAGADLPTDFRGFSGSPVVVAGAARAVIQRRLDGGLGAISLARLRDYLEAAGVRFHSARDQEPLPASLAHALGEAVPNRRTLWQLEGSIA